MKRTTGICLLTLAALAAVPAHAADEDTQLWVFANTVVPLGQDATGTFEISPRFRETGDQLLLRGTAEFKLLPSLSVGGGAAWVEFTDGHEFRPHQQLTFTSGPLALRTRVEERFFAGNDRPQMRLRQRVQLSRPLDGNDKVTGSAELLYIARPEVRTTDARVDSWRFTLATQHKFSPHLEAGVGYLLMVAPRDGAPDRVSHVPQLTLVFRP